MNNFIICQRVTEYMYLYAYIYVCVCVCVCVWNSYSENVLQVVPLLSTSYYFFVLRFYPNWQVQTRFP